MNFSTLALRPKQSSSVSPGQIPTSSQPQLPAIDVNTTASIEASPLASDTIGATIDYAASTLDAIGATNKTSAEPYKPADCTHDPEPSQYQPPCKFTYHDKRGNKFEILRPADLIPKDALVAKIPPPVITK
ncbi:hypothetical protein SBOR_0100 [Sclerotinia borealis F-4128]|uniref:Uncharacterized protein n=1 Tax=Sclerotinia borealis (strain F-4128) TaxID=1432307 RepID=W9CY27_SCLBF|nr:hypothetical protein SBOR_0100 [Sclerotinia borealis F-4128]